MTFWRDDMDKEEMKRESIWRRVLVKATSSKLIVTVWAMVVSSYIVFADKPEFEGIAYLCIGTVLAYILGNVIQKGISSRYESYECYEKHTSER